MSSEETKPIEKDVQPADAQWERRVLCSDESCTGTISPDGKCRVCGKPYAGDAPIPTVDDDADTVDMWEGTATDEDDTTQGDDSSADNQGPDSLEETDTDWDNRVLCSDESCTGTIGSDGRCRVCGKIP